MDETALAACLAYVDLNPIRAGIAESPEASDFTSIQARIEDRRSGLEALTADAQDVRVEQGERAGWLAPMALEPPRQKVRKQPTTRRASNQGCLPMTLDEYLKLVDWTGRQIRKGKSGQIPSDCTPILDRLECDADTWLDYVVNFRKRTRWGFISTGRSYFHTAADSKCPARYSPQHTNEVSLMEMRISPKNQRE